MPNFCLLISLNMKMPKLDLMKKERNEAYRNYLKGIGEFEINGKEGMRAGIKLIEIYVWLYNKINY